jgi:predicted  nucleic acid-binding Zn-ribbon protein
MVATASMPETPPSASRLSVILASLTPTLRDDLAPLLNEVEALRERIAATISDKSRSYVHDAKLYASLLGKFAIIARDYAQIRLANAELTEQVTAVQERCTALLEDNRELVRLLKDAGIELAKEY